MADFHAQQLEALQDKIAAALLAYQLAPTPEHGVALAYALKEKGIEHETWQENRLAITAYNVALEYAQLHHLPEVHWLSDRISALSDFEDPGPFLNEYSFPPCQHVMGMCLTYECPESQCPNN
jgi:hypothetical protein